MNICQIQASQLCDFVSYWLEGGQNSGAPLFFKLDA